MKTIQGMQRKFSHVLIQATTPTSPLAFTIVAQDRRARRGVIVLPHGVVETPVFMPVGTQGTIKGLTPSQVAELGVDILLGNAYHLAHRPGADDVAEAGGLHDFMNWSGNILTDSGGFQMVSLQKLAGVVEEGVTFKHPHDGTVTLVTPEESIKMQQKIAPDIMMALDDVVPATCPDRLRVEEATARTTRWLDRCIEAHDKRHERNLFGIVQGGLHADLRDRSLRDLEARDLPGYAIGGLSGGESKADFARVIAQCTAPRTGLPHCKPRYAMGVGYQLDIVVCVALGVDMFDCVYPCRTARFGTAIVPSGTLRLKQRAFREDKRPLCEDCDCYTCRTFTRAYLHAVATKETAASFLLTLHNLRYMTKLCESMRDAISSGRLDEFVRGFLQRLLGGAPVPVWVRTALEAAGISLGSRFRDDCHSADKECGQRTA